MEGQLEQDEQKFHEKLLDDEAQLEDKLDNLQLVVAGFSGRTDLGKAAETANEVRRMVNELKGCQQHAQLYMYNQRERLFNMLVIQYNKFGKLLCDFDPYKNLWVTVADWSSTLTQSCWLPTLAMPSRPCTRASSTLDTGSSCQQSWGSSSTQSLPHILQVSGNGSSEPH